MRTYRNLTPLVLLSLSMGCSAEAEAKVTPTKLAAELETELALSAGAAAIRAAAGVYIYDETKGLVEVRKSQNGYNCFVARTDIQALQLVQEYRDDILVPICFDAVGSEYIFPMWTFAEASRVGGMSATDLAAALKTKVRVPSKAGVSAMISPILRTYGPTGSVMNLNYPHYMFYAPGASNAAINGSKDAQRGSPLHPWVDNDYAYEAKNAYLIHAMGAAETAEINKEHAALIDKLCAARSDGAFCLDRKAVNAGNGAQPGLKQRLESALQALGN